jgi:CBS domain-containing protein
MNRELLAVRADTPARDALSLLQSFGVGAAPVLDEQRRPLGVVSLRDLIERGGIAQDRMTAPAVCVSTSAPVEQAARQLARTEMHHLVVVDGSGVAVGMLSSLDALRAVVGVPTRHPAAFPHWDEETGVSWTDDWPFDLESASHAPEGAGVLALTIGPLGERDAVVWAEASSGVRQRVRDLATAPARVELPLARVLCLRDLRFRAARTDDAAAQARVVALLRDHIERTPPPGST